MTFHRSADLLMASVAGVIDDIEANGVEVHTIMLARNGEHGEFDLTVLGDKEDGLVQAKWTAVAYRGGAISHFEKVR